MYTGSVSMTDIVTGDVPAILLAADELQLNEFLDYVQEELIIHHQGWLNGHCIQLLQMPTLASCDRLRKHCEDSIFNADDFASLDHDTVKSFLEQDALGVDEITVWRRVLSWGIAQHPELV